MSIGKNKSHIAMPSLENIFTGGLNLEAVSLVFNISDVFFLAGRRDAQIFHLSCDH